VRLTGCRVIDGIKLDKESAVADTLNGGISHGSFPQTSRQVDANSRHALGWVQGHRRQQAGQAVGDGGQHSAGSGGGRGGHGAGKEQDRQAAAIRGMGPSLECPHCC
jgi:hypothetical protein